MTPNKNKNARPASTRIPSTGSAVRSMTTISRTGSNHKRTRPRRVTRCECGEVKPRHATACRRCTRLDGQTRPAQLIISALRTDGPLSVEQIAADAGMTHSAVERWIERHARDRRVVLVAPGLYWLAEFARPSLLNVG
jgi:hypothetical protein